jgi:hypothetical protein
VNGKESGAQLWSGEAIGYLLRFSRGPVRSLGISSLGQAQRGLSADSHTPAFAWFAQGLVPSSAKGSLPALCPAARGSVLQAIGRARTFSEDFHLTRFTALSTAPLNKGRRKDLVAHSRSHPKTIMLVS